MSINRVVLIGRLTRDPELKTTSTGRSVTDFSIAVQKRSKPQDGAPDADFFRVSCWEKTAEIVANYCTKGKIVAVEGRLQSRKYTDQQGNNREVVEIVADNVQLLGGPRDDAPSGSAPATVRFMLMEVIWAPLSVKETARDRRKECATSRVPSIHGPRTLLPGCWLFIIKLVKPFAPCQGIQP
jgi:single-strand DNA-binding protein